MSKMPTKLQGLRNRIAEERMFVDIKPYSHNIIGLLLRQIDEEFGEKAAKAAMKDLELEELGWRI